MLREERVVKAGGTSWGSRDPPGGWPRPSRYQRQGAWFLLQRAGPQNAQMMAGSHMLLAARPSFVVSLG